MSADAAPSPLYSRRVQTLLIAGVTAIFVAGSFSYFLASRHSDRGAPSDSQGKGKDKARRKKKKMTPLPSGSNSEGTLPEKPAATPPPPAEPAVVLEIEKVKADVIKIIAAEKDGGPKTPDEIEAFVMQRVAFGEALAAGGPSTHYYCAMEFYRAVRAYPDHDELLAVLGRTAPPEIYALLKQIVDIAATIPEESAAAPAAAAAPSTKEKEKGWETVSDEGEVGSDEGSGVYVGTPLSEEKLEDTKEAPIAAAAAVEEEKAAVVEEVKTEEVEEKQVEEEQAKPQEAKTEDEKTEEPKLDLD